MQFRATPLDGAWVIDLEPNTDDRGAFARTFCEREFADHGLPVRFPQANLSGNNTAYTLRGMHFNRDPLGEEKLVRCVRGALYDVIVDLRTESATRFRWFGAELTADNGRALFVPKGFAHGFVTLADHTDAYYHMGEFFQPGSATGVRWDDPTLAIAWPATPVLMSERDATYTLIDPETFDPATWQG